MIHHEKVKQVRNYLESDPAVKPFGSGYDAGRKAEIFTLQLDDNTVTISVPEAFFIDIKVDEIKKKLQDFRLLEFIRYGRSKQITVTRFGLKLED